MRDRHDVIIILHISFPSRELMSGVETLRLVSQVLASIDKVADESDDASPGEAKSPPKSPDEGATGDGDNT